MDIIDILIASANAVPADVSSLVRQAQQAVAEATTAVNRVTEIEDDAEAALAEASSARDIYESIATDFESYITAEVTSQLSEYSSTIDTLSNDYTTLAAAAVTGVVLAAESVTGAEKTKVSVTKNSETTDYYLTNYTGPGNNEDGAMTQKAITTELNALAQAIEDIGSSGGSIPVFPITDEGKLLMISNDGSIIASSITANSVINTQMATNTYMPDHTIGLTIDYVNKTCTYLDGSCLPNELGCYSGRKRCILNSQGQVVAYYGDSNYAEDGSIGDVMVELPPVWYRRTTLESANGANNQGAYIRKEQILISDRPQVGFELHPLFNEANTPVYISAYEGAIINNVMRSIIGVQPTTNITLETAQNAISNNGFTLTNLAFESYNQLLMLMEFGTLNIQNAFYPGVSAITTTGTTYCAAVLTGSTSSLGNTSGEALSSVSVVNGVSTTYTESGKVSITYRGMENPYGNTWRYITNLAQNNTVLIDNIYYLSTQEEWISSFNATISPYFLPISTSISADSTYPVGDYIFINKTALPISTIAVGGAYNSGAQAGPFTYAINRTTDNSASIWRGFRLMYGYREGV